MIPNSLESDFYTFEEMCTILRVKPSTLNHRISKGTDHPPCIKIGRVKYFSKRMFNEWMSTRNIMWEVKGAS